MLLAFLNRQARRGWWPPFSRADADKFGRDISPKSHETGLTVFFIWVISAPDRELGDASGLSLSIYRLEQVGAWDATLGTVGAIRRNRKFDCSGVNLPWLSGQRSAYHDTRRLDGGRSIPPCFPGRILAIP